MSEARDVLFDLVREIGKLPENASGAIQGVELNRAYTRAVNFLSGCQHDPMKPDCTLQHQFTEGRTRCDVCSGIFHLPVTRAG